MALINRFSRLFRADLHAVLDRIEEPTILLKQAVREMEDDVAQDERNLKFLEHELTQIPVLENEIAKTLGELQQEIGLCLESDNEKLARSVIRRKLECQQHGKRLRQKSDALEQEVAALVGRVETNRNRLTAMQQKLEILEQDDSQSMTQVSATDINVAISEDEIEVALLREKQARAES